MLQGNTIRDRRDHWGTTVCGASAIAHAPATAVSAVNGRDCSLNNLAFDYYGSGASAGNDFGTIRVRDVSTRPCLLRGPIVVAGIDATRRIVTQTVSYPVATALVLTPRADRVPPGDVAPPGETVGDLMMAASYRDDPSSEDGICRSNLVVPTAWRLSLLRGTRTVANNSYDPAATHTIATPAFSPAKARSIPPTSSTRTTRH